MRSSYLGIPIFYLTMGVGVHVCGSTRGSETSYQVQNWPWLESEMSDTLGFLPYHSAMAPVGSR